MSLFTIKHATEEHNTPLGYGVVRYEVPTTETHEDEEGTSFTIDTDETVLITGQVVDTPRWIMVTDRAGGTLHIPHHAIDQIVTCENEEAWDSYRLHADLEDAMGADH